MGRGRPRKTDPEAVLETSIELFWEKGYEGTSMNDLAAATGMAKPGLYATFGDKETLYAKALRRYAETGGAAVFDDLITSPDPLDVVVRRSLRQLADGTTEKNGPGGCLLVNTLVECAHGSPALEALSHELDAKRLNAFMERFRAAKKAGELPPLADPRRLAEFFSGQVLALAVMGRSGASQRDLERFIDVAMTVLPVRDMSRKA